MKNNRSAGFTMVELMIGLALLSLTLVLAVTSFRSMIQRGRAGVYAREFVAAANLARSEALRRGTRVTLCRSSDGAVCGVAGDLGSWGQGWMAFSDTNGDALVNGTDEVVLVHGAIPSGITVVGSGGVAAPLTDLTTRIVFSSQGAPFARIAGVDQVGVNGSILVTYVDPSDLTTSKIIAIDLSATGRLALRSVQ